MKTHVLLWSGRVLEQRLLCACCGTDGFVGRADPVCHTSSEGCGDASVVGRFLVPRRVEAGLSSVFGIEQRGLRRVRGQFGGQ